MPRTNTYMNWKDVTVTPGTGSPIPITEVLDVQVVDEDNLEMWQADGHKFATQIVAASGVRGLTIIGGDLGKLAAIPKGTPCTVVAKLYDSKNGVGIGCLTHTLSNAVLASTSRSGTSNKFAGGSVTFAAYSSDGTADPLVTVEATS